MLLNYGLDECRFVKSVYPGMTIQVRFTVKEKESLLATGNAEGYSAHKKRLPAVTFCATFDQARRLNMLKSYNSIIVLDIDKLDDTAMKRVHAALTNDPFVFAL